MPAPRHPRLCAAANARARSRSRSVAATSSTSSNVARLVVCRVATLPVPTKPIRGLLLPIDDGPGRAAGAQRRSRPPLDPAGRAGRRAPGAGQGRAPRGARPHHPVQRAARRGAPRAPSGPRPDPRRPPTSATTGSRSRTADGRPLLGSPRPTWPTGTYGCTTASSSAAAAPSDSAPRRGGYLTAARRLVSGPGRQGGRAPRTSAAARQWRPGWRTRATPGPPARTG